MVFSKICQTIGDKASPELVDRAVETNGALVRKGFSVAFFVEERGLRGFPVLRRLARDVHDDEEMVECLMEGWG